MPQTVIEVFEECVELSFMLRPFTELIKQFRMILRISLNDVKKKYAGSALGLLWAFLYPLLFLGVYSIVYAYVFQVRFLELGTTDYILVIFCGLIPFLGFSESVQTGLSSVTANSGLIKNTMFPIEYVPVKTIFSAQVTQIAGSIILLCALTYFGKLSITTPLMIVIWLLQLMFQIGLVWILSSLNVIARDLQSAIGIIMIMLMMLSPIAYPVDAIPAELTKFVNINPLFSFIVSYQNVLMYNKLPSLRDCGMMLGTAFGFYIIGYYFFMQMKKVFSDNV